jgi:hypothetical protein
VWLLHVLCCRRNEEQKAERVAARKKQRTDEVQTKRANIQQMLEGMTPEQVAAWRADQQVGRWWADMVWSLASTHKWPHMACSIADVPKGDKMGA